MKLQELLEEYRDGLPDADAPTFEVLLQREKRRQVWRMWLGAGIAAVACLVAVLAWPAREQPRPVAAPFIAAEPVAVEVARVEAAVPVMKRAMRRRTRPVDEIGGFVAIAETSMLPQPAMFQVLRVSVSGPRLAALGVLRPDQMVSPTMTADVLLGDDGMARAIRVVANE